MRITTREDLVRSLIRGGIESDRVIEAFRNIPRDAFVPTDWRKFAFNDRPIPIPHSQVTTQPSLSAKMLEALELGGDENVLEVGTGYGFQTAILSRLSKHVWSIETWKDIAESASSNLTSFGITNVTVIIGDGTLGLPSAAPFDAILVSAAHPEVPPPLIEQLRPEGRLVQPVGWGGMESVILFQKENEDLKAVRVITGAHFVRLQGSHGFKDSH